MEQSVELLEPLHAKEDSRANLQCDDVRVVGVRTGISEVLVLSDLPLSSIVEMLVSNSTVNSTRWTVVVLQETMSGCWSVLPMSWGRLYRPGRSAVI